MLRYQKQELILKLAVLPFPNLIHFHKVSKLELDSQVDDNKGKVITSLLFTKTKNFKN